MDYLCIKYTRKGLGAFRPELFVPFLSQDVGHWARCNGILARVEEFAGPESNVTE